MPRVEYHLILVLICLVKSGISLDLRKNFSFFTTNKFLAPLPRIELEFKTNIQIKKRVSNLINF